MRRRILPGMAWMWRHLVGGRLTRVLIRTLAQLGNVELLDLAYREMGILNYENSYVSGEHYLMFHVLKNNIVDQRPTLFDVGANRGGYSAELREAFPSAEIFAFEPNPHAFELLRARLSSPQDHTYCLGMGNVLGAQTIYTYGDDLNSEHASMCRSVFEDVHRAGNVARVDIQLTTVDQFCDENDIKHITFLKIDTEGYELEVLRGASRMLEENRVGAIQFEFNAMHAAARVFLRDFYTTLHAYDIYRLHPNGLIPLPTYNVKNEIFQFQNFVALSKNFQTAVSYDSLLGRRGNHRV